MYTNNADKKNKNYRLLKNLILKNRRDLKMIFLLVARYGTSKNNR